MLSTLIAWNLLSLAFLNWSYLIIETQPVASLKFQDHYRVVFVFTTYCSIFTELCVNKVLII